MYKHFEKDPKGEEKKLTDEELNKLIVGLEYESLAQNLYELSQAAYMLKYQKAEIERLTEELEVKKKECRKIADDYQEMGTFYYKETVKTAKLQKQVDELLNRRIEPKIFHCHADTVETCPKVQQAVKDRTKEIYELLDKWEWKLKNEKGNLGKFRFAIETVMQEIKEKYLLEVANFKLVELKKGGRK